MSETVGRKGKLTLCKKYKDVIHLLILAGDNEMPSNHYGTLRDA